MSATGNVAILGATGSIGRSTLDVIARHPDRFRAFALTANSRVDELCELPSVYRPRFAVVDRRGQGPALAYPTRASGVGAEVLAGPDGLVAVASASGSGHRDGSHRRRRGLAPTLAAAYASKKILLANKEALVMAAPVFMAAVREARATLLPIDSEHNAIFQCLPQRPTAHHPRPRRKRRAQDRIDRLGRAVPRPSPGRPRRGHARGGVRAPDLAHGAEDLGRLRDDDEQSARDHRGKLAVRRSAAAIEVLVHPQSVVHSMVVVCRRIGDCTARQPRHAYADRTGAGTPGPHRRRRRGARSRRIGTLTFEAPDFAGSRRSRSPTGCSRRGEPRRPCSMPPTRSR